MQSANSKEIEKFSKSYYDWWDSKGMFASLHQINPVRVAYIIEKIRSYWPDLQSSLGQGLSIIEIGCGGGIACSALASSSELSKASINGIDASESNIEICKQHAASHSLDINYFHTSLEDLALSNKKYDVVLCLEVIEHVDFPEEFIFNLSKILDQNGIMILSTINRNVKSYFEAIILAEHVLRLVPVETHDYHKFIKPSELSRMLTIADCEIKELKGLHFSLKDQSWVLNDHIGTNYFMLTQKR
jgi:2-polyprenyl-6-hydroxyphenyl methylase/3-demethylubiquinone-9 3-methyltransferase